MSLRTIEVTAFILLLLLFGIAFHAWDVSREEQQRLQSILAVQKQVVEAADSRERQRDTALGDTLAQIEKLKNSTQSSQQMIAQLQSYLALPKPITLIRGEAYSPVFESKRVISKPTSAEPKDAGGEPFSPAVSKQSKSTTPMGQLDENSGKYANFPIATQEPSRSSPSRQPVISTSDRPLGFSIAPGLAPSDSCPDSSCSAEIPAPDLKPLYNYVQDCRACEAQLVVAKQNASDDATKIDALTRERDAAITASKGGSFWRRLRRNALWFSVGAALAYAARR